jgi:hypothetical protein
VIKNKRSSHGFRVLTYNIKYGEYMDRRINAILAIIIAIVILPTCAQAIPIPHGVAGTVYRSDGATQVPVGASFSVSGTTADIIQQARQVPDLSVVRIRYR